MPFLPNSYAGEPTHKPFFIYQKHPTVSPIWPLTPPHNHSLDVAPILQPEPTLLRRNTRFRKPLKMYDPSLPLSLAATLKLVPISSSYKQAMEHKCWQNAIEV